MIYGKPISLSRILSADIFFLRGGRFRFNVQLIFDGVRDSYLWHRMDALQSYGQNKIAKNWL